jgi:hypothetical protein
MVTSTSDPPRAALVRLLAALALVALLGACMPTTGLQSDGSVVLRAERAGDGWRVSVPEALVGRTLVLTRPFAASVTVPRGFAPPPGLCRSWRPGVAPALQAPFAPCPVIDQEVPAGVYLIRG